MKYVSALFSEAYLFISVFILYDYMVDRNPVKADRQQPVFVDNHPHITITHYL